MTSIPSSKPHTEVEPVRVLLGAIVDYAGLFPPAGLDMAAASVAFDGYRRGEHKWMLRSLVVPLGRFGEWAAIADALGVGSGPRQGAWSLSLIVGSPRGDAALLADVQSRYENLMVVGSLEVGPIEANVIRKDHAKLPEDVKVYYEVPLDDGREARLDAIAAVGACAKVRTGGVRPEMFPSAGALAGFVFLCAERGVPFKATAGLHHAFHGRYPLSYEPGSDRTDMHGFLELALVAGLVHERRVHRQEATSLLESGGRAPEVEEDSVSWRGYRITREEMGRLRQSFFHAFGSCSFEEPVSELTVAGLI